MVFVAVLVVAFCAAVNVAMFAHSQNPLNAGAAAFCLLLGVYTASMGGRS